MKSIFKIVLLGIFLSVLLHTQADARGEIPPPPPFMGGNVGDWLGSGPIFGFEGGLGNPWTGGGFGSGGGGGSPPPGGGSNGGWGGAWWEGDGPLGGGGWGGWGGWGSGIGSGAGGRGIDTDTSKKGHIWPDDIPSGFKPCFRETWTGPTVSWCACFGDMWGIPPGGRVSGQCNMIYQAGQDRSMGCEFVGVKCFGLRP